MVRDTGTTGGMESLGSEVEGGRDEEEDDEDEDEDDEKDEEAEEVEGWSGLSSSSDTTIVDLDVYSHSCVLFFFPSHLVHFFLFL